VRASSSSGKENLSRIISSLRNVLQVRARWASLSSMDPTSLPARSARWPMRAGG
jgi:hypothetical protein